MADGSGFTKPSTSCTGVCLAITMLQYYICLGIVLTVILVLGVGVGFGINSRSTMRSQPRYCAIERLDA